MMQTLVFETAWDKTIAQEDREAIIDLFHETKKTANKSIAFTPITQSYNYRGDLLIMVLVHNFTGQLFSFEKMNLIYKEKDKDIAAMHFSFPGLKLDAWTSMPWTFIFPMMYKTKKL